MQKSDRDIVIGIVSNAFEQNPRAQAMMKKKNPSRSVRLMTEYAYQLVEKFDGIYLSEDKSTVLFYYRKSTLKIFGPLIRIISMCGCWEAYPTTKA